MSDYYKLVGHKNSTQSWSAGVVLERDGEGNVTKQILVGEPTSELTAEDRKKVEDLGFVLEKSSAKEAEELAAQAPEVGADVAGQGPVFGGEAPPAGETKDKK
jgi:hypothetical protein